MNSILLLGQISLNRDVKCVWEREGKREKFSGGERDREKVLGIAAHSLYAPLSYQKPLHY